MLAHDTARYGLRVSSYAQPAPQLSSARPTSATSRQAQRLSSLLGRQLDASGGQSADYLVVQSVTRYQHAACSGELTKLGAGEVKGIQLFPGEAAHAGHGDFPCSRAFGVIHP